MFVIAGLGNPGRKYAGNRHNVGFMAVDAIARRHNFSPWSKKFNALVSEGRVGTQKVLLMKPQTFMNRSGQAVGEAMRFYKLGVENLIVLYDELDLAPGKLRVKKGGGSGGHNGIKSIDAHCGKEYRRVRIGIGHPGDRLLVHNHVLSDFTKADQNWLEPLLEAIAEYIGLVIEGDDSSFMNKVSLALRDQANMAPPRAQPGNRESAKQQGDAKTTSGATPGENQPSGPMAAMLKKLFGR